MADFSNYSSLPDKAAKDPIEVKAAAGNGKGTPRKPKKVYRCNASFAVASVALLLAVLIIGGVVGFVVGMLRLRQDGGSEDPIVVTHGVPVENAAVVPYETLVEKALVKSYDCVVDIAATANAADVNGSRGSGVVYAESGSNYYILTNNHVVEGAGYIVANIPLPLLPGQTDADAISIPLEVQVQGYDADTDLAVLKFSKTKWETALRKQGISPTGREPQCAVLGSQAAIRRGAFVLAIGNALGELSRSITWGVISSTSRKVTFQDGTSMELVQHDAAVNPGNSGGGLFDANGQLIGIVNAKSTGSTVDGVGYAIPIQTFSFVARELMEKGYVSGRPQLGVLILTVDERNASAYSEIAQDFPGLEQHIGPSGLYVAEKTVAATSLEVGDLLLEMKKEGDATYTEINGMKDIRIFLARCQVGETVKVKVYRITYGTFGNKRYPLNSQSLERSVVLTEKNAPDTPDA